MQTYSYGVCFKKNAQEVNQKDKYSYECDAWMHNFEKIVGKW